MLNRISMAAFEPPQVESPVDIDEEGWAYGPDVECLPSVRKSPLSVPQPTAIVWHYTAVAGQGYSRSLARRIQKYKRGKDRPASWHFLVAKDGKIYQSVSCLDGSWHCSRGRIEGHKVNRCAIGIELENAGRLRKEGGRYYLAWGKRHRVKPESRAVEFRGRYYDTFTDEQVEAARKLTEALVEAYDLTKEHSFYGHWQFDPGRRSDPGELWTFKHQRELAHAIFNGGVLR